VSEAGSAKRPDDDVRIEENPRRVKVLFNGVPVADSTRTRVLHEASYPPVHYFPRADVRMDLMHATRERSYCPFRGNASYWNLTAGERTAESAVWSYEEPYENAAAIKKHFAFDRERVDVILEEGTAAAVPSAAPLAGVANPLVAWLVREAHAAPSARDLVEEFARAMLAGGIPVWRIFLTIRTLHPLLVATGYTWEDNGQGVRQQAFSREGLSDDVYLDSPVRVVLEGAGGLRRRLDVANPTLDFPIVRELREQGATDYVVMPFPFSSGQVNAITFTTRQRGGFDTADLGHLYEVLPLLSRVFEVHAQRLNAVNLLDTYLGKQSGAKVLDGLVKRGDGEDVHAVIWFSDLRNSTPLADSMPRSAFLRLLDGFFECTAGAVLAHGGEVLRYIGDASLAIFPISEAKEGALEDSPQAARACETALTAALEAQRRLAELNAQRSAAGEPHLGFGIGLHVGDVLYGNIGTPDRLEFSVIGAAANEAARIEGMSKVLGASLVVSAAFARHVPDRLRPLGRHALRGVGAEQELYTLRA
jgi:adenylate cyclase